MTHSLQMDLHEAQQKGGGGGGPMGSPMEINNLKQQLQDTKKKLEAAEKQPMMRDFLAALTLVNSASRRSRSVVPEALALIGITVAPTSRQGRRLL